MIGRFKAAFHDNQFAAGTGKMWHFLTGERAAICKMLRFLSSRQLIADGFSDRSQARAGACPLLAQSSTSSGRTDTSMPNLLQSGLMCRKGRRWSIDSSKRSIGDAWILQTHSSVSCALKHPCEQLARFMQTF